MDIFSLASNLQQIAIGGVNFVNSKLRKKSLNTECNYITYTVIGENEKEPYDTNIFFLPFKICTRIKLKKFKEYFPFKGNVIFRFKAQLTDLVDIINEGIINNQPLLKGDQINTSKQIILDENEISNILKQDKLNYIWLDVTNDEALIPLYNGGIVVKVLFINHDNYKMYNDIYFKHVKGIEYNSEIYHANEKSCCSYILEKEENHNNNNNSNTEDNNGNMQNQSGATNIKNNYIKKNFMNFNYSNNNHADYKNSENNNNKTNTTSNINTGKNDNNDEHILNNNDNNIVNNTDSNNAHGFKGELKNYKTYIKSYQDNSLSNKLIIENEEMLNTQHINMDNSKIDDDNYFNEEYDQIHFTQNTNKIRSNFNTYDTKGNQLHNKFLNENTKNNMNINIPINKGKMTENVIGRDNYHNSTNFLAAYQNNVENNSMGTQSQEKSNIKNHKENQESVQSKVNNRLKELKEYRCQEEANFKEKIAISDKIKKQITKWSKNSDESYKDIKVMLSTLDDVLWENSDWKRVSVSDLISNPSAVKKAYKSAILLCHPDKHRGKPIERVLRAELIFQALNNAFKEKKGI
ncbi:DnaJ protein, putative [Plasmodium yoelii]|uniref:DnaJ protein n=2 Tax=Plasmodium yoelii TaxID=5861 RepID=A0AAE9WPZ7_PLAYO|nr:DnaJ protein, putative [Plasmodium yoelii]WBY58117.1 DnaJ protein [Plasmodium yoelii yoelii]CDU85166.1 conserved Plasmodium protein, unknown function [Plasmodium yoelii]VTZ79061.1 DnaJ protein, putative [Plasmodium yoelii]|eukprot:XP_022813378.1 DnaJ protein, putative [Plasmodium yoelii]